MKKQQPLLLAAFLWFFHFLPMMDVIRKGYFCLTSISVPITCWEVGDNLLLQEIVSPVADIVPIR